MVRAHVIGFSYFCNIRKAFMFLNVKKSFLSTKFFSGGRNIYGISKSNWLNRNDNLGSKIFRIVDRFFLNEAINFALQAYEIAEEWSN